MRRVQYALLDDAPFQVAAGKRLAEAAEAVLAEDFAFLVRATGAVTVAACLTD